MKELHKPVELGECTKCHASHSSSNSSLLVKSTEMLCFECHKKKEAHPQSTVPPLPEDEEIYKLLTAIQQLDFYIKKFQDEQFELLKEQEKE